MLVIVKKYKETLLVFLFSILESLGLIYCFCYYLSRPIQTFINESQLMFHSLIVLGSCFVVLVTVVISVTIIFGMIFNNPEYKVFVTHENICIYILYLGLVLFFSIVLIIIKPITDMQNNKIYSEYLTKDIILSYYSKTSSVDSVDSLEDIFKRYGVSIEDNINLKYIVKTYDVESWIFTEEDSNYFKEYHTLNDFREKVDYYIQNDLICSINHLKMEPEYCTKCGIAKSLVNSILLKDSNICSNCGNVLDLYGDYCNICGVQNRVVERVSKVLNV